MFCTSEAAANVTTSDGLAADDLGHMYYKVRPSEGQNRETEDFVYFSDHAIKTKTFVSGVGEVEHLTSYLLVCFRAKRR